MKGAKASVSLKGRAVLIVEDDARLAKRLQALLAQEEAAADVAASLRQAREALARGGFDFLLLDVHLPDGNGLDLELLQKASPIRIVAEEGSLRGPLRLLPSAPRTGVADHAAVHVVDCAGEDDAQRSCHKDRMGYGEMKLKY